MNDLLTQSEAAEIIGVHQTRISYFVRNGRLPAIRVGLQTVIRRRDAERFRDIPRRVGRPPATPPQPAKGRRKG